MAASPKPPRRRETWRDPQRIWQGYTGALNSVIQLRSGRILLPFSYRTPRTWRNRGKGLDTFTFRGPFDCTLVYSDDNGDSWHLSSSSLKVTTPDIVSAYGAVEPVVLELDDGRVWMLIRTQLGRFYESYSGDGATWSEPRPTRILSSDSPAGLVRLTGGRIVLFWNKCLRFPYAYGTIAGKTIGTVGQWHTLEIAWDGTRRAGSVSLDGRPVRDLPLSRETDGACYLRLRSTASSTDDRGFLVASVKSDVSASYAPAKNKQKASGSNFRGVRRP